MLTQRLRLRSFALVLIFPTWLVSCGQSESSQLDIVQGQLAEAKKSQAVALLKADSAGILYVYCSGVLISQQHVLTAAHCSQDHEDKAYAPEAVRVIWGEDSPEDHLSLALSVKALHPHASYQPGLMGKDEDGLIKPTDAFDIAVWELEEPVSVEAQPAKTLSFESRTTFTSQPHTVTLSGFGAQDGFESPWTKHLFREAKTPYQPHLVWDVHRRVRVNGRLVTRVVTMELPGYSDYEFYAGAKGQPDTCKGDSGGPVWLEDAEGSRLLVGITSRGDASCDRGGVYTLVPAFSSWFAAHNIPVIYQ